MLESSEGGVEGRGWAQDSDDPTTRDRPVFSHVWSQAWVNKHYDYLKRELSRKIQRQKAARCDLTWRRKQDEEGGGWRLEPLHHTRERSYRAATFSASNSTVLIILLVFLFNFFEYTHGM